MTRKKIIILIFHTFNFIKSIIGNYSLYLILNILFTNSLIVIKFIKFSFFLSILLYLYKIISEVNFNYIFDNNKVIIKKGIFFKKSYIIKYNLILGIKFYQPIYYRIFKIYNLKLILPDTGDNKLQIIPAITKTEKLFIENIIYEENIINLTYDLNIDQIDNYYRVSLKKIILSSLITLNYLYIITIFFTVSDLFSYIGIDFFQICHKIMLEYRTLSIIIIFILSCFSAILKQILKFSNFKLTDCSSYIEVSNSIIKTASTKIKKEFITGYLITNNIGQSILQLCSLSAIILNSDSNNQENKIELSYILPLQNKKDISKNINNLFPNFIVQRELPFNQLFHIRIAFIITLCFLNLFTIFCFKSVYVFIIQLIFTIIVSFLVKILLTQVDYHTDIILISTGIITRKNYILKSSNLEWKYNLNINNTISYCKIGIKINKLTKISYFS